jgi:hypothetical protein
MPHVEKKDLLEPDCRTVTLLGSECSDLGFKGGAKSWGRERVFGLRLSVITKWNRSTCLASWVTGSSWGFCKQRNKQAGEFGKWSWIRGSGFGISLGNFRPPQEFQSFVGIMGADWSSFFMLNGGIVKVGFDWNVEVCEVPRSGGWRFFPGII